MKTLIATPCFGGQLTDGYFTSAIRTIRALPNCEIDFYTLGGESLISRARNHCAQYALDKGYDKLLFIDADISWEPAHVEMLLSSKHPLVGGTYPLKTFPATPNFNPLEEHEHMFTAVGAKRTLGQFLDYAHKYADENGEVEVRHIPTGFMLIDRSVLEKLQDRVPCYTLLHAATKKREFNYDFFPVRVVNGEYESEDWAFCSLAREAGFKVMFNTKVLTRHIGIHTYRLT